VTVECGATTVQEALQCFAEKHLPRAGQMLFDRQGRLWSSLIVLLNEEPASQGPETPVTAGDVVSVLVPLAGG